jgi:CRP-like cAMP-binding protein
LAKSSVLLRKLPSETKAFIQRSCKLTKVAAGETVYAQGDSADIFYMVESGRFRATQHTADGAAEQVVREFGAGSTFGSHELLSATPTRCETVTVLESGAVWVLVRKTFDAKLKVAPAPPPKLVERVRTVPLFAGCSQDVLLLLCRACVDVKKEKGEKLYNQGDPAVYVYALSEGRLKSIEDGDEEAKKIVSAPSALGESSLYPDEDQRVYDADVTAWAGPATLMRFAVAGARPRELEPGRATGTLPWCRCTLLLLHARRDTDIEALVGYSLQRRALAIFNRMMLGHVTLCSTSIFDTSVTLDEARARSATPPTTASHATRDMLVCMMHTVHRALRRVLSHCELHGGAHSREFGPAACDRRLSTCSAARSCMRQHAVRAS